MPGEGVAPCLAPLATLLNHRGAAPHVVRYGGLSSPASRREGSPPGACTAAAAPGPPGPAPACAAGLQGGTEGSPAGACAAAVASGPPGPAPARGEGSRGGADAAGDALELRALRPCAAGEQVGRPAAKSQPRLCLNLLCASTFQLL